MLHNLRVERIGGRVWARWWAEHAAQLWPGLRAEIERETERLSLVARQIRTLEAIQEQQVRSGVQPAIAVLARLAGIGTGSAASQRPPAGQRTVQRGTDFTALYREQVPESFSLVRLE